MSVSTNAVLGPHWVASLVEMSPIEKHSPPAMPLATAAPSTRRPKITIAAAAAPVQPSQSRISVIEPLWPPTFAPPASEIASASRPIPESPYPATGAPPEPPVADPPREEGKQTDPAGGDALDERQRSERERCRVEQEATALPPEAAH